MTQKPANPAIGPGIPYKNPKNESSKFDFSTDKDHQITGPVAFDSRRLGESIGEMTSEKDENQGHREPKACFSGIFEETRVEQLRSARISYRSSCAPYPFACRSMAPRTKLVQQGRAQKTKNGGRTRKTAALHATKGQKKNAKILISRRNHRFRSYLRH